MGRQPGSGLLLAEASTAIEASSGLAEKGNPLADPSLLQDDGKGSPRALQTRTGRAECCWLRVVVVAVDFGVVAAPSVLGCRPPGESSQGGICRGQWTESSLDLDHRPHQLAWAGAVESLSWAERDRPLCQDGTPSLRWPRSGQEKSAPGLICLGGSRVERTSAHHGELRLAWILSCKGNYMVGLQAPSLCTQSANWRRGRAKRVLLESVDLLRIRMSSSTLVR